MKKIGIRFTFLFIASSTLLFSACYKTTSEPNYGKLGLVDISGVITLDGQPLEGAAIFIHDRPNRRYSFGFTNSAGHYSLMFDSRKSGVLPGNKEIRDHNHKEPFRGPSR